MGKIYTLPNAYIHNKELPDDFIDEQKKQFILLPVTYAYESRYEVNYIIVDSSTQCHYYDASMYIRVDAEEPLNKSKWIYPNGSYKIFVDIGDNKRVSNLISVFNAKYKLLHIKYKDIEIDNNIVLRDYEHFYYENIESLKLKIAYKINDEYVMFDYEEPNEYGLILMDHIYKTLGYKYTDTYFEFKRVKIVVAHAYRENRLFKFAKKFFPGKDDIQNILLEQYYFLYDGHVSSGNKTISVLRNIGKKELCQHLNGLMFNKSKYFVNQLRNKAMKHIYYKYRFEYVCTMVNNIKKDKNK